LPGMCKGQSERIVLFAVQKGNLEEMATESLIKIKKSLIYQKKATDKLNIARPFREKLVEFSTKIMKRIKITILIKGIRKI
jgi:hypothetical protein